MREIAVGFWNEVCILAAWVGTFDKLPDWLGAIGTIVAIFFTWGLSRAEYWRTKRISIDQRTRQIEMLRAPIYVFDGLVSNYISLVRSNSDDARGYYERHSSEEEIVTMAELSTLPLVNWPNPFMCWYYRRYWNASIILLKSSRINAEPVTSIDALIDEHKKTFNVLNDVFDAEEFYIKKSA